LKRRRDLFGRESLEPFGFANFLIFKIFEVPEV